MALPPVHPILSCEQALRFEQVLLRSPQCQWEAMRRVGKALALALLEDWRELGGSSWHWGGCYSGAAGGFGAGACSGSNFDSAPKPGLGPRVLVLVGKGHNGADALLAATELAARFAKIEIVLYCPYPVAVLRPLCRRAWEGLFSLAAQRAGLSLRDASGESPTQLFTQLDAGAGEAALPSAVKSAYAFCIDGLLGMQFRPPLRQAEAVLLAAVNGAGAQIGLRAAVDLPSGLGEAGAFCADFTYATAIAKRPVFKSCNSARVGRLRYLDVGFFRAPQTKAALAAAVNGAALDNIGGAAPTQSAEAVQSASSAESAAAAVLRVQVLTEATLDPFRVWRSPFKDKRHYGHLFVLGGSAQMPGALLMNVQAALRSGAGLVTAFAPQSVAHVFAAQAPEAMWVPWPQTDEGTLALEGQHLLIEQLGRATALLVGSGMGRSAETLALVEDIARTCDVPLVLDADALQSSVLAAAKRHRGHGAERPLIITPHGGEFLRLYPQAPAPRYLSVAAGNAAGCAVDINDIDWSDALRAFCQEHGVITVFKGAQTRVADAQGVAYSLFGGPVLARGGSGDVLAGLLGGCLVQQPQSPLLAAQQAVCWHGLASQSLACEQGQISVTTMDLVRHLAGVIRNGA